jgi:preprotein translocase subunit SecA
MYDRADEFVRKLRKLVIKELDLKVEHEDIEQDYIVDEKAKTATLTKHGIEKAEKHFGIENLADNENNELYHHIQQALRAHGIMHRDTDYVIKDDQVVIVDTFTGRLMPGRRYSDGLHQAIEAKEKVKIQRENRTIATITFQNYFRMYRKLSGMTGTALSEENEFREIYDLDVVVVPTNKQMIRVDHNDFVFKSIEAKDQAIIKQIKECHKKGQPVLVGTVSIEKSEALSRK